MTTSESFVYTHNVSGTNPVINTYQGILTVRMQELLKNHHYYGNHFQYFYISTENYKKLKKYIETHSFELYYYSGNSKEFIVLDDRNSIFKLNLIEDNKTFYKMSLNLYRYSDDTMSPIFNLIKDLEMTIDINTKINNYYIDPKDGLCCSVYTQKYSPEINQLAYPYIPNINDKLDTYFNSNKSVYIFLGEPGTGKTSLIRNIAAKYTDSSSNGDGIFFTSSAQALNVDTLFQKFMSSNSRLMVLEDIDIHLSSRSEGNEFMYKLLSTSDGFIKSPIEDKKIIISTNLPNIRDIDDALIRKGRCFGVQQFERLNYEQSVALLDSEELAYDWLEKDKTYTIADLYNPD